MVKQGLSNVSMVSLLEVYQQLEEDVSQNA